MGYLDKYHHSKRGTARGVVEAVEYAALSYGFGYAQNRYREKASLFGVPADLLAGGVMKAMALFGGKYLKGAHSLVDTAANAGIGAFFHTMGAGHGGKKSGLSRVVVPAGDVDKVKKAVPSATILGDIPKQTQGAFLSTRDLAELSR